MERERGGGGGGGGAGNERMSEHVLSENGERMSEHVLSENGERMGGGGGLAGLGRAVSERERERE